MTLMSQRQDVVTMTFTLCRRETEKTSDRQDVVTGPWRAPRPPRERHRGHPAHCARPAEPSPRRSRSSKARRCRGQVCSQGAHPAGPSGQPRWPRRRCPGWRRAGRRPARPPALWVEGQACEHGAAGAWALPAQGYGINETQCFWDTAIEKLEKTSTVVNH